MKRDVKFFIRFEFWISNMRSITLAVIVGPGMVPWSLINVYLWIVKSFNWSVNGWSKPVLCQFGWNFALSYFWFINTCKTTFWILTNLSNAAIVQSTRAFIDIGASLAVVLKQKTLLKETFHMILSLNRSRTEDQNLTKVLQSYKHCNSKFERLSPTCTRGQRHHIYFLLDILNSLRIYLQPICIHHYIGKYNFRLYWRIQNELFEVFKETFLGCHRLKPIISKLNFFLDTKMY